MATCKHFVKRVKNPEKTHFFHVFPPIVRNLDRKLKKALCTFLRKHLRNKMTPTKKLYLKNCRRSSEKSKTKNKFSGEPKNGNNKNDFYLSFKKITLPQFSTDFFTL